MAVGRIQWLALLTLGLAGLFVIGRVVRSWQKSGGTFFAPGPNYWELRCHGDYSAVLVKLAELLPPGLTLFVEGTHTAPLIAAYLEARKAEESTDVKSGTIWPRSRSFHMPLTQENIAGLADLMDRVAEPEVGDHLHAYKGTTPYLIWYDALSEAPMYLLKDIPEEAVLRLCRSLGCEYSASM